MRARSPWLAWLRLLLIPLVLRVLFAADPAAPHVVAGVDEDSKRPGDKRRLSAKAGNAALNFQERILAGVFPIALRAEQIPAQVPHSRALALIEPFIGGHIAGATP